MGLQPGQVVELTDAQFLTVPRYARGTVMEVNYERSEAGYCICVEWSDNYNLNGHRRQTWVPERCLKVRDA